MELTDLQIHTKETETDIALGKQPGKIPITPTKDKKIAVALR